MKYLIFCFIFLLTGLSLSAQITEQVAVTDSTAGKQSSVMIDYANPRQCVIAGMTVTGVNYLNADQILSLTGLAIGDTINIPGEELQTIVKRLFMQRFFSDVGVYVDSLVNDQAFLNINIVERPRVSQWNYNGVKKGEKTDIEERVRLRRGSEMSDYVIKSSSEIIRRYYVEKGFLNCQVTATHKEDTTIKNAVQVTFHVDRKARVRIKQINFLGSDQLSLTKMRFAMKKTKDKRLYNFFFSKKFDEKEYLNDKQLLLQKFHELGYRDACIVRDSIYYIDEKNLGIDIQIDEGKKYYFRNITWTGNTQYSSEMLNSVLRIGKGDVYDVVTMEERLFGGGKMQQTNVSQVYKDQGYLFFRVVPVEVNIEQDSVDVEMRVFEGKPATYNRIIINGNNVSNEKIIRRQVFTRPGYLFSQTELERSIREIASMGHFDQEAIMQMGSGFNVVPNQVNNTVDIIYNVTEKPDSQFEIAGGWGGNTFVGTVGISFNNFSINRLFDKQAWRPVPLGDGQTLSLRFQTNGTYYMALSSTFVEPWLTGKKPTSFSTSIYYTRQTASTYYYLTNDQFMEVYGLGIGLGTRLKWPDNYFVFFNQLDVKRYNLQDWGYYFMFTDGQSNIIDYTVTLQRNSTDQIIYPRQGSDFKFGLQVTPPYSLFRSKDTDYASMTQAQRYRWIEYHKWTFDASLYTRLIGDLVLMTRANFGYLGYYNRELGYSPFEGFMLGGDGMSGYNTYGADIISQRGYKNYSLTPTVNDAYAGRVYTRYTVELRYPVILQPQSTIYALLFLEGGNCWSDMRDFNPFSVKRAAGVGVRVFLPMIGLLGIDWGYGFDTDFSGKKGGSNFHFMIGQTF
ncbi:MAG: POTRA domain-containing protein [Bacteroidales bacterium]|jgi:outer membrane protein insertion porin family|nr:outer membrane protein assembly factor BamA [Bacteroidales bacterium]MDD2264116.1 POTRA domain-containing protein [Bacteroidales bacterium]MDD2831413.1 POTRA domain-containing protein [Bacteroidales bacterium]MDD3208407.1 POTRA domain-containing protein [Bacteroidales bacterium]MDD3696910.1 POTRA domain-containing protein [Bacteroidales bacterium]